MKRMAGPYYVDGDQSLGDSDIIDCNVPPDGQPGLHCSWEPSSNGEHIIWDGTEKFYYAPEWMAYIVNHFLKPDCEVSKLVEDVKLPHPFLGFTFNHMLNGEIEAQGEDPDDRWKLIVENNTVYVANGILEYGPPQEIIPGTGLNY